MKRYCINIVKFLSVLILITVLLSGTRILVARNLLWRIPPEKHILFLGASHMETGVDDSLLKEGFNL